MRPKLLEIEGLQSFREVQRIDFEALGETGLFGIFGPTGSGKSTVLDAITFALYGRVKRAERGTQGIINSNVNTVRVVFTFVLLKGDGRKTYRVERTYQRRKGSENSCEPKVARLIEVTEVGDIPVCDRASEVSGCVEELLGLSHDDFTRAVVLPQNSFQEFLLLDNSKKRDMLERIFYLEEYGRQLAEKLNRKLAGLRSRIDRLSGELKAYADATDEALAEAGKARTEAADERTRIDREFRRMEVRYNEAREVWQLVGDLSVIGERESRHAVSREAMDGKRVALDRAVKAEGLLGMIRKNRELETKLGDTQKQLEDKNKELPGVVRELDGMRKAHEELKREAAAEQPRLAGLKAKLAEALGVRSELGTLRIRLEELRGAADKLEAGIAAKDQEAGKCKRELETLEKSLGSLAAEIKGLAADPEYRQRIQEGLQLERDVEALAAGGNELKNQADTLGAGVAASEQKLARVRDGIADVQKVLEDTELAAKKHGESLADDRKSVLGYRERIQTLHSVYGVLKVRKAELDGTNSKRAGQESAIRELEAKRDAAQEEAEKRRSVLEECRRSLDAAIKQADGNAACLLAKSLREGEPCPVCGSQQHPRPAAGMEGRDPAELEQQAEQKRKALNDAEAALREAEKDALIAGEQLKALTLQYRQTVRETEDRTAACEAERLKLPETLRNLEAGQIGPELERMRAEGDKRLEAFEAWEKKLEGYRTELKSAGDRLAEERLAEKGILTELKVNRESLAHLEKSMETAHAQLTHKRQELREFLRKYEIGGAAAELKRLAENDRKVVLLQDQADKTKTEAEKKKALLEQSLEEARALKERSIKARTEADGLEAQKNERMAKLRGLAGAIDIADLEKELEKIDKKSEEYAEKDRQYGESLKALEKRHNDLLTARSTLENQHSIYSEDLKKEKELLEASLREKGFTGTEDAEGAVVSGEEQKALKDGLEKYETEGHNIRAQKEMLLKKLNSRSITGQEWEKVSSGYQELAASREKSISLGEIAANRYDELQLRHDKWAELNRDYNGLSHTFGLYEQIQKLLRAEHGKDNSFIDYIAEERLRYVAAEASETLGVMTKYKYALELDTNAGFIIRDNANGGVHRMVTSLSGGETFLTSLALALALSSQIQLKGQSPLEFFFLDEGFGTLDNDLLDTVIDSLERLSRKDRVIGLISHVPEIRNRLARRLVIDAPASGGGGSRVRLEKA